MTLMEAQLMGSRYAVAYIKYNKASAAALAVENLHEAILNEGRGPTLKVMLAETPHARYSCPSPAQAAADAGLHCLL